MEQRLSFVTLGVTDLARSVAFYERLGWRQSEKRYDGVAFFQANGLIFGLYPREDLAKDAQVSVAGQGFAGFALAHNTRTRDEVDGVLAEAMAAGATIVKPAEDAFWGGYSGYFTDPDGFLWEVAWNPGLSFDDRGNVAMAD